MYSSILFYSAGNANDCYEFRDSPVQPVCAMPPMLHPIPRGIPSTGQYTLKIRSGSIKPKMFQHNPKSSIFETNRLTNAIPLKSFTRFLKKKIHYAGDRSENISTKCSKMFFTKRSLQKKKDHEE